MKRTASGVAACAVLLLALTACTSGGDAKPNASGGDPVKLVVWESLEGRSEFIKQAGKAFTAKNPRITIEYKNVELGDSLAQIALDGPGGIGPDVFAAPSNVIGDLVTGGHILPIADEAALTKQLLSSAVQNVTYDDAMYAVPVTVDTYALFYNKALVPKPPTTWDDVISFSRDFNAANPGKYGFVMQPAIYYGAPFAFTSPDNLVFGPDGSDPKAPNTDTPATAAGMKELVKLRSILDVPAADLDAASVDSLFEGGQAAMEITGSWNIPVFDAAGLDYAVTTLPARAGSDKPSGSFSNSRSMFVSAYTEHPDEAQQFAAFLASPEMLKLAYDITGSVPSAEIKIDSAKTLGLVEQGKYAFATPSLPQMTMFWQGMDAAVANIWNGAEIQPELDAATKVILGS